MSINLAENLHNSEKGALAGKILLWVFVVLIIGSVGFTYWRIMIKKDFIVSAEAECDPYSEACFVWECDPQSTEEGEACTGDPEVDVWNYKIINRRAFNIPLCDPNAEDCEALMCPEGEADCEEVLCDEETGAEQEVECNDPVQYTAENPVEEECDPEADETCLVDEEGGKDLMGGGEEEAAGEESEAVE